MEAAKAKTLTILHFNDCYNIEERAQEPIGGVARFHTAVHSFKKANPLVFFSGDLVVMTNHPVLVSNVYAGKQLIKPINSFGVNVALYGNHDFDYEEDDLINLTNQNNFPWLLSNVTWIQGGRIANGKEYVVLEHCGHRIGVMGLIEYDWLETLDTIPIDAVKYTDFVKKAKELSLKFKTEEKCDLIIALTHMRSNNDALLAKEVPEVDLILGGHDHIVEIVRLNETYVIKSGTDFRNLGHIELTFPSAEEISVIKQGNHIKTKPEELLHDKFLLKVEILDVTSKYEPCLELQQHVDDYLKEFAKKMDKNIAYLDVELETRFAKIRTEETNSANFFGDLVRASLDTDIAIYNAGTIRADTHYKEGFITLKDLLTMHPYMTALTKLELTGEAIIQTLENGFSKYPALEGRFPMVSGITMDVDTSKPPGQRVVASSVKIKGKPIDLKTTYSLTTPQYMANGADGYEVLIPQKRMFDDAETPYFMQTESIKFFDLRKEPKFLELYSKIHEKKEFDLDLSLGDLRLKKRTSSEVHKVFHFECMMGLISRIVEDNEGEKVFAIAPKVENRIRYI